MFNCFQHIHARDSLKGNQLCWNRFLLRPSSILHQPRSSSICTANCWKKIIKWHRKQNGQLTYIGDISSSRHSSNSLPTWSTLRFANGTYVPALAPALGICRLTCVIPITFSISSFMMSMVLLKWSQVLPSPPIDYNSLNVSWSDAKCGSNRGSKCSADFFNYFLAYTYIHRVDIHSAHEF